MVRPADAAGLHQMNRMDPMLLRRLAETLRAGGIEDAELEAKWITEDAASEADALEIAQRRAKHEPLQYLLGTWEFYGLPFCVGEGVLIPRADTETLVDAVRMRMQDAAGQQIADLCTGSGCIALALAAHMPLTQFTGIDISGQALEYAQKNIALNGARNMRTECADVLAGETAAQYHGLAALVCNPPYLTAEDMQNLQAEVRYEPALALFGGTDGLDFYRRITALWRGALAEGGLLAFETGCTQGDAVREILSDNGFHETEILRDLGGNPRVVLGRK